MLKQVAYIISLSNRYVNQANLWFSFHCKIGVWKLGIIWNFLGIWYIWHFWKWNNPLYILIMKKTFICNNYWFFNTIFFLVATLNTVINSNHIDWTLYSDNFKSKLSIVLSRATNILIQPHVSLSLFIVSSVFYFFIEWPKTVSSKITFRQTEKKKYLKCC